MTLPYREMYPDTWSVCVTITTGTQEQNAGNLIVSIGSTVVGNSYYGKEEVVIDSCMADLESIRLSNPSDDAWTGNISISVSGQPTILRCAGCSGYVLSDLIVVDGDSDERSQANTQCLDGNTCSITWEPAGK